MKEIMSMLQSHMHRFFPYCSTESEAKERRQNSYFDSNYFIQIFKKLGIMKEMAI
jgi:hypothetical protein